MTNTKNNAKFEKWGSKTAIRGQNMSKMEFPVLKVSKNLFDFFSCRYFYIFLGPEGGGDVAEFQFM